MIVNIYLSIASRTTWKMENSFQKDTLHCTLNSYYGFYPLFLRWLAKIPKNSQIGWDINNAVGSLYVEIIDKNRSYYKCTICGRKLSRKQRLKTHSEQAWLLCWSICWSVSVKHDPSNDPGSKKWRFDAKGKPWRSTLWQRKKFNRKLESYNNADEKRRSDVFNLSC